MSDHTSCSTQPTLLKCKRLRTWSLIARKANCPRLSWLCTPHLILAWFASRLPAPKRGKLLKKMLSRLFVGIAVASICTAAPSLAAAKKRAPSKRATPPAAKIDPVKVMSTHLFLNTLQTGENIAQACRRTDFKLLAISLQMNERILHQEKGEFETTAEFNNRVARLANAVNGGSIVICQPLNDNEDLPFAYNADDQSFEGSFARNQNVWRDVKQLGRYRSKTRMGIAATVKASAEYEYNVAMRMPEDGTACGRPNSYASTYQFRVPVPAAQAPQVKASGYAVFIGKLIPPYIGQTEESGKPTLDDPYDEYEQSLTVSFQPQRVAVVDGTGKELWSCTPDFPAPNSPPRPKSDPAGWVMDFDYPFSAKRENRQGVVEFALSVDAGGRVTACKITSSSGSADLDEAACTVMRRRAQFKAATDANGNSIDGIWSSSVRWKL